MIQFEVGDRVDAWVWYQENTIAFRRGRVQEAGHSACLVRFDEAVGPSTVPRENAYCRWVSSGNIMRVSLLELMVEATQ